VAYGTVELAGVEHFDDGALTGQEQKFARTAELLESGPCPVTALIVRDI